MLTGGGGNGKRGIRVGNGSSPVSTSSSELNIGGEGCRCDILTGGGCDILTGGGDSLSLSLSEKNRFFFATCVPEVPGCGDTGGGVTGGGVSCGESLLVCKGGVCGGGVNFGLVCQGGLTGGGRRVIGESLSLTLFLGGVALYKSSSLS